MDIAALSMGLSQMNIANQVSTSVMKMAMDNGTEQIEGLTQMMEQSVNPHLGSSLDIKL